jgi:hypothetical protein
MGKRTQTRQARGTRTLSRKRLDNKSTAADGAELLYATVRERHLQNAIVKAARLLGWLVHHTRPALSQTGRWHTPLQGHTGFPDLVLVYPARGENEQTAVIFAELKSEQGRVSDAQRRWQEALQQAHGVEYYIWRPSDLPSILARLERRNKSPNSSERET